MANPIDGYGVYEGSRSDGGQSVWGPRLTQIAAGGFKLVLNYSLLLGHATDMIAYINYAASLGLKVIAAFEDVRIWRDNNYSAVYSNLYADAGNPGTGIGLVQYAVAQIKALPGLWGYYVGDEVQAVDHATFKTYCDAVKAADSTHPRLFFNGGSANGGMVSSNSFGTKTSVFWDCCDVGGDDYYPLDGSHALDLSVLVTECAGVQDWCNTNNVQSAIVLQAHSFKPYGYPAGIWPSENQMKIMRNTAIANMTPRLIMWYSYFDVTTLGTPDFAPAGQWNALINAMDGRSSTTLFPAISRRGSIPSVSYTSTKLAQAPTAYYRMNEPAGATTIVDATGGGHNSTAFHGSPTLAQSPGPVLVPADTAIAFNGTTGYIALPAALNGAGWDALTLECWCKPNIATFSPFAGLLTSGSSASHNGYVFYFANPAQLNFTLGNGTTTSTANYNMTLIAGTWYHIAATWSSASSTLQLYVNGLPGGTSVTLTGTIGNSGAQAVIGSGSTGGSLFFPGQIGQVAIHNAALSASQILQDYNTGIERLLSTMATFPATSRRSA
jgi:hypothetical protein